ncbi:hypothetical protein VNO77_24949 [Canavalia gladiata]|uniref:Uncharacterized protein n=1 Tax=Canavalia gladiata TaxID=3824 RepID=A0AAN9L794_CANGL
MMVHDIKQHCSQYYVQLYINSKNLFNVKKFPLFQKVSIVFSSPLDLDMVIGKKQAAGNGISNQYLEEFVSLFLDYRICISVSKGKGKGLEISQILNLIWRAVTLSVVKETDLQQIHKYACSCRVIMCHIACIAPNGSPDF